MIQTPYYSEDTGYGTHMPFELRVRMSVDSIAFCAREMPKFHAFLEDTYYISDGGLDAVEEMALGFVEIRGLIRELLDRGVPVDSFAPRIAILDWEMANISDLLADLTWWVWVDRCNSEGLGFQRLGGLPDPAEIYADWHERTGRSIDNIAWFELFAVVRYAIILELKFKAMREINPDMGIPPNFAADFIPELITATR